MTLSGVPLVRVGSYSRRSTATAPPAKLLSWERHADIWLGTVNGQIVGTISHRTAGYRAVDWTGEVVGRFLTLRGAQNALDSTRIADQRDSVYPLSIRIEAFRAGILAVAVVVGGLTAGLLLIHAPL